MNIAQALKEKNRTTGRINRLERQINSYNRYMKDEQPELDVTELMAALEVERKKLVDLKTSIGKANSGIIDLLVQLEEAKSELTFWEARLTNHGPPSKTEECKSYVDGEWKAVMKEKVSVLSTKDVYAEQDRLQKVINDLQDKIDTYNATTTV